MNRREFIQGAALFTAGACLHSTGWAQASTFPVVRAPLAKRRFTSEAVEKTIAQVKAGIGNKELAWMFENCFPNTLDTTVDFAVVNGEPDTYVITGDIDAMWLRDSSAQVWPYLALVSEDPKLQQLISGVIRRQTRCILKDPYANAFYKDDQRVGEWKSDRTDMKPGVHERKWEIDSLCFPIRLAHEYWRVTNDTKPFNDAWRSSILLTYKTFREQQRKHGRGPYKFQRRTEVQTDTLASNGYGRPAKPVGLICSMFRPSDDATVFPYLIPANFFAVVSLRQAAEMLEQIHHDTAAATQLKDLAREVEQALAQYGLTTLQGCGRIYAYEVDAYGSFYCADDANVPSLLSLPYLGAVRPDDELYQATRRYILSDTNPYFCRGKAGTGLGGPHVGLDMIWPLGLIIQGITSSDDNEIRHCLETLRKTHAGTGFMHEAFHKDDATHFTRSWFAWANTMFGEFVLKVFKERPHLLKGATL